MALYSCGNIIVYAFQVYTPYKLNDSVGVAMPGQWVVSGDDGIERIYTNEEFKAKYKAIPLPMNPDEFFKK